MNIPAVMDLIAADKSMVAIFSSPLAWTTVLVQLHPMFRYANNHSVSLFELSNLIIYCVWIVFVIFYLGTSLSIALLAL